MHGLFFANELHGTASRTERPGGMNLSRQVQQSNSSEDVHCQDGRE